MADSFEVDGVGEGGCWLSREHAADGEASVRVRGNETEHVQTHRCVGYVLRVKQVRCQSLRGTWIAIITKTTKMA